MFYRDEDISDILDVKDFLIAALDLISDIIGKLGRLVEAQITDSKLLDMLQPCLKVRTQRPFQLHLVLTNGA